MASRNGRSDVCIPTHERASPSSSSGDSDLDSLFDEPVAHSNSNACTAVEEPEDGLVSSRSSVYAEPPEPLHNKPAHRTAPPIPGLHFDPRVLLPDELAEGLLQKCIDTYFRNEHVNQVMLFERVVSPQPSLSEAISTSMSQEGGGKSAGVSPSSLPSFLKDLLCTLSECTRGMLPLETHELLFPPPGSPPKARQVIINLYRPGEGITPHVDLLDRFGDGIIGVSLGSGCVMDFVKGRSRQGLEDTEYGGESERAAVFLPHGSVYVMSGKARYDWTHGIDGRKEDWVEDRANPGRGRWVMRSIRVSITFRWLLPGADIVGGLPDAVSGY